MAKRDHLVDARTYIKQELEDYLFGEKPFSVLSEQGKEGARTYKTTKIGDFPHVKEKLDLLYEILDYEEKRLFSGIKRDGTPLEEEELFSVGSSRYIWSKKSNKAYRAGPFTQEEIQQREKLFLQIVCPEPERRSPQNCDKRVVLPGGLRACISKDSCQYQYGRGVDTGTGYRDFCSI